MNQKGLVPILIILGTVIILSIAGGAYYFKKLPSSQEKKTSKQEQSSVSTTGNNKPQIVKINGTGMYPLYKNGQTYLVKNNLDFQRGDVIVYRNPKTFDDQTYYVKRIIGLPGENVKIQGGKVYINGAVLNEPYLSLDQETKEGYFLKENQEIKISENSYFVLGDNRAHSSDSREWGFLPKESIIGKVGECYITCSK